MPDKDERKPLEGESLTSWLQTAGRLIACIGKNDFLPVFCDAIEQAMPSEFLIIFLYRQDAAPALLHDTVTMARTRKGLMNYLENSYVLNPFYRATRAGIAPGIYHMKDFTPEGYVPGARHRDLRVTLDSLEEIGFLTKDWPSGMHELLIAIPLDGTSLIEVSLSRKESAGGFPDEEVEDLRRFFPVLRSTFVKHWELAAHRLAPELREPLLERLFLQFGQDVLSEREREVVRLILLGHSSSSIALRLDVALPTVKTHRRNAYAKLGISSQAELFALFTESVRQPQG